MTLLLLRGPQTPGELRSRAERLHPFASVTEVEETLTRLAGGFDPLVAELPRQPGQRETRWAHLVGDQAPEPEPAEAEARPQEAPPRRSAERSGAPEESAERLAHLEASVAELHDTVSDLARQLRELRSELGVE